MQCSLIFMPKCIECQCRNPNLYDDKLVIYMIISIGNYKENL